jgi:hypothetical protein
MIEFDHTKRLTAADAMNHAYFIPSPSEMVKADGNEFQGDSLSKYNQYTLLIQPLLLGTGHTRPSTKTKKSSSS